jgi:serine/threonine protein phosphatase PrpC
MLNHWSPPLVGSSAGASHRRRGQPCQDASLVAEVAGADGMALTLMAVADGHGASAYRHSAVGSAAACRVALEAVAEALAQPEGDWRRPDPGALERWLGRELPAAIRRRWLEAIRRHWRGLAAGGAEPFQPRPYGTTLALVLLTPGWWAYTGLGDWDLVRIDADGARLLSQEEGEGCGGEATASLAIGGSGDDDEGSGGGAPFPFRWRWFGLEAKASPFALVLSTDGIRKSCASDADFLALASWLATGMAAPALEDSLERISREGCGDDVSVAIVRWGELGAAPPRPSGAQNLPALPVMATVAEERRAPGRPGGRGMVAGLAVLAGLVAVGASIGLGLPQRLLPAGDPLAREVERLCASPGLAAAALASRRSQFEGLRQGRLERGELLAQRQRDPLGALIASTLPAAVPPTRPGSRSDQVTVTAARRPAPGRPCPALNQALDSLWARSAAVPATGPGLAGSAASPAGEAGGSAAAAGSTARQEAAIRTVTALYGALARGDGAAAAAYLGAGAADQFALAQFRPYAQVELEALGRTDRASDPTTPSDPPMASDQAKASDQATASHPPTPSGQLQRSGDPRPGRDAGAVTLVGVVRLVDRDGRIQRERRFFRVEQEGGMARVTASAFGAVLEPGP